MATINVAKFLINSTPSEDANGKRGYDAIPSENLAITLEKNPATSALTTTYELADVTKPDAPLDSLFETLQEFTQNNAQIITVSPANSTVNIIIDAATEISTYTLRATVITATGTDIFERLVVVREQGLRMTIPAETAQYAQRGWSDALNELTKAIVGLVVGGPAALVSSTISGAANLFPAGQKRIFHSDGGTDGGTWAVLNASDMTAALAVQSIDPTHIVPSVTNNQVLTTVAGVTAWATPAAGGNGSDPTFKWVYDVAIVGDSATGHFRYDSADTTTVTKINIHSVMDGSINALAFTNNPTLLIGGVVYVSNVDGSKIHAWKVTGVTDFGSIRQEWDVMTVGATQTTQFADQDVLHLTFPGSSPAAGNELVNGSSPGIVQSFAAGVSRFFWSDGAAAGGLTTEMVKANIDTALAIQSIDITKLVPGTDGQLVKTTAGSPEWATITTADIGNAGGVTDGGATSLTANTSLQDQIDLLAGGGLVSSTAAGTVNAYPAGVSRILWSDGTTDGVRSDQMRFTELNESIEDGQFPLINLQTGVNGNVLTIVGTIPTWFPPASTALVSSSAAGTVNSYPVGVKRFFWSDGTTDGIRSDQMNFSELDGAIVDGQFPLKNLQIGADDQILTMISGTPAWTLPSDAASNTWRWRTLTGVPADGEARFDVSNPGNGDQLRIDPLNNNNINRSEYLNYRFLPSKRAGRVVLTNADNTKTLGINYNVRTDAGGTYILYQIVGDVETVGDPFNDFEVVTAFVDNSLDAVTFDITISISDGTIGLELIELTENVPGLQIGKAVSISLNEVMPVGGTLNIGSLIGFVTNTDTIRITGYYESSGPGGSVPVGIRITQFFD